MSATRKTWQEPENPDRVNHQHRISSNKDIEDQKVPQVGAKLPKKALPGPPRVAYIQTRNAVTPGPTSRKEPSMKAEKKTIVHQKRRSLSRKSKDFNNQLPEDWTAKLSSDDFLKQWYSSKDP